MSKIIVQNTPITVLSLEEQDYISLTDMATAKEGDNRSADIIKNWLRNRYTIEFLGTWEVIHNPNFKVVEFDHFRMSAGLPSFVLSASEWIERTNAIRIIVKKGRYGGTYAHKDIAFELCSSCKWKRRNFSSGARDGIVILTHIAWAAIVTSALMVSYDLHLDVA